MNAVDCSCVSPKMVVSASDDFKTWDVRVTGATGTFKHDFPCTTAVYGIGGYSSYSNGFDDCITACWELRNEKKTIKMKGHLEFFFSLHRKFTE